MLTHEMKVAIVEYFLSGCSKGIFEDLDIFNDAWDEDSDNLRKEADEFVAQCRERLLAHLSKEGQTCSDFSSA